MSVATSKSPVVRAETKRSIVPRVTKGSVVDPNGRVATESKTRQGYGEPRILCTRVVEGTEKMSNLVWICGG